MSGVEIAAWTALALAGLAGSAIASGLEMGVYALGRYGLETRALRGERSAVLLRGELSRTDRLLATLLVHNNLCNYLGVLGVSSLLTAGGLGAGAVLLAQSVIVAPVLLILAESVPKELFRVGADSLTYRAAPLLRALRLFYVWIGVVPLVRIAGRAMAAIIGGGGLGGSADSRQRMAVLLKDAGSADRVGDEHAMLIDRALAMGRTTVADEMLPWSAAQHVQLGASPPHVRRVLGTNPGSTVPITDAAGAVIGLAGAVDLLTGAVASPENLKPVPFVERDTPAVVAIRKMLAAGADLAVVGAPRRPVGIVTLRHLAEPLLGSEAV
ncbi:MAG: CNNM domain-containing protein [Planctomycetota bacterium]